MTAAAFQNEPVLERTEPNSKGRRLYATMNGPSPANRVGLQAQDGLAEASEKTGNIWAQFAERDNPTNSDINVEAVSPPQSATPSPGLPDGIDVVTGIKYHTPRYNNTKSFRDPYEKSQKSVHSLSKSPEIRQAPFQLGEMATRNQSLSPPFGTSQATSGFTCQRPGISSAVVPFNDGCTIVSGRLRLSSRLSLDKVGKMCWAACRKLESAFEDSDNAGWFTKALTEYLARPINSEENLRSHNKTLKDQKRNLGEQHPQLFVSKNIGLALEDYLRLGLKI
ncbi:hypothetical protein AG1IA_06009 [Rhizoctonia solani AG-1 IA]|uniref:Uncharacterized protein n=1 Tax=Thanatephorus cucumeris (strain AG1-IA) TaxID=983506 RepID=L8WUD2_THACA|nr:hypothetical protein AG1IA_06009 [Rhizoctonia solani AG-1 IA]